MALKAGRPTGRTSEHIDRVRQQLAVADGEARLNVRMPKSEYRRLRRFALEADMSVSDVVRVALKEYMSKNTVDILPALKDGDS